MMHGTLTILTFVSALFLTWPFTALLALIVSIFEPMVPLAVGLFTDTLYYTPQAGNLPMFTFAGALLTAIAFFVRSRLSEGIINK